MRKKAFVVASLILVVVFGAYLYRDNLMRLFFKPRPSSTPEGIRTDDLRSDPAGDESTDSELEDIKIIAEDLSIPWEIVFIDEQTFLVTERPGNLMKVTINGEASLVQEIPGVAHLGEGGLMGMALHPDFENNRFLYLYLTSRRADGGLVNRVERYVFDGERLSERTAILDNILGAQIHDGGRIAFGPDGYLYITTGDAARTALSQDTSNLSGKILRIADDGTIPSDNSFGNEIYSYGHRNPQGITWDSAGKLWATEHGPTGHDELNLIEMGGNYGWPEIIGDQTRSGMINPVIHSGAGDTWAPSGAAYYNGRIFFAGLRGVGLYEADITDPGNVRLRTHFKGEFGRLRAVVMGPNGFMYITTNNTDGRGSVNPGDDKIIRINPEIFFEN